MLHYLLKFIFLRLEFRYISLEVLYLLLLVLELSYLTPTQILEFLSSLPELNEICL